MRQNRIFLIVCTYLLSASISFADSQFPTAPDSELTPGALCIHPDQTRYSENIAYCDRAVNSDEKWVIIMKYMKKYNFTVDNINRADFKIDHYIPLCMGGANSLNNLWPQHKSVYLLSDPLEVVLCQKLANGKMTQHEAIEKMKQGKQDYKKIPALILELTK